MPIIGAHVSAAVALSESLVRADHIGAQTTQIFISPPQQWSYTHHHQQEINNYLNRVKEFGIQPNFIHGTYLINLGTDNPAHLKKSIDWLTYGLETAGKLQIKGVIFHTGSHKGRGFESVKDQIIESIQLILSKHVAGGASGGPTTSARSDEGARTSVGGNERQDPRLVKPYLILENAAGAGGVIGSFQEIGEIIKGVGDERVKFCLDTQHTFAAGYDLRSKDSIENLISTIDHHIGWDNLVAIHCNDSKTELGSNRDRHENIGEGFIGKEAFKLMLNHPKFADLPFILEVPGFSGNGPDRENIDLLKSLKNS